MKTPARRPLALREHAAFKWLARRLGDSGVRPNAVSFASVAFVAVGAVLLVFSRRFGEIPAVVGLFLFPLFVLLRSICNLIDGMIAVEGGQRTASGEIFNDFPDRISDPLMFIAVGYAAMEARWGIPLGWAAALASVVVAYVRVLGGATGASQHFIGPMAKTHRMLLISAACMAAAIERLTIGSTWSLSACLAIAIVGCAITIVRRLRRIEGELEAQ